MPSDLSPSVATSVFVWAAERGHYGTTNRVDRDLLHAAEVIQRTVSLKTRAALEIQIEHSFGIR